MSYVFPPVFKNSTKFKIGQHVKFIGGCEENYHPEYVAIMNRIGIVKLADGFGTTFPYEIQIDGVLYPAREKEIEGI